MATVRINRATIRVDSLATASRLVRQVLYEVEFLAKIQAAAGPYASGNLSNSIHSEGPVIVQDEVRGAVGSDLRYAASVHSGAEIHNIFPKGAPHVYRFGRVKRPALRFYWRKAGKVVYMNQIPGGPGTVGRSHPGQKGKHYLSEPLREVARRHRMHYITRDI